jgi:ABC-type transport system involved in cytochrome c biogenesis permease subunit
LSTHVTIITISYAAFFLAFALGDVLLFFYLKDEKKYAKEIQAGCQSIYRSMQIGVVLLAAGTILGGIWADYSWGRFWGWDPKETWALIALLGYLAVLHGRLTGWVKNFELAAGAIVMFSLVIMAWYGVNFVLGAGLHSYGFGAGGVEYVTAFVVVHLLYVVYVSTVRYGRQKSLSK